MKLIRNKQEYEEFLYSLDGTNDIVTEPLEYPCYGYFQVDSWQEQKEHIIWLTIEQLSDMINQLKLIEELQND